MPAPRKPKLRSGKVYRTRDFIRWGANPTRLAKRLLQEGLLEQLSHGLFFRPKKSKFGNVPPSDEELMRGFLGGGPFTFTGPDKWNALGLGSTALYATRLVYNTKRSGQFDFGGRRFSLRRVKFPRNETPEWYVVDLLENSQDAGVSKEVLLQALKKALSARRFSGGDLVKMAEHYGSRETELSIRDLVEV